MILPTVYPCRYGPAVVVFAASQPARFASCAPRSTVLVADFHASIVTCAPPGTVVVDSWA